MCVDKPIIRFPIIIFTIISTFSSSQSHLISNDDHPFVMINF